MFSSVQTCFYKGIRLVAVLFFLSVSCSQVHPVIKNIVFDLGGVLLDTKPKEFSDILQHIVTTENWKAFLRGKMVAENACKAIVKEISLSKKVKDMEAFEEKTKLFWKEMEKHVVPIRVGVKLLEIANKSGDYKLYILSDFPKEFFVRVKKEFSKLFEYFDGEVVSYDAHHMKPDEKIYQMLFKNYRLKSEECLFIDDKEKCIKGGEDLGMHGVLWPKELTNNDNIKMTTKDILEKVTTEGILEKMTTEDILEKVTTEDILEKVTTEGILEKVTTEDILEKMRNKNFDVALAFLIKNFGKKEAYEKFIKKVYKELSVDNGFYGRDTRKGESAE